MRGEESIWTREKVNRKGNFKWRNNQTHGEGVDKVENGIKRTQKQKYDEIYVSIS